MSPCQFEVSRETMIPGMVTPGALAGKELLVALPALAREHAVALPGGEDFLAAFPENLPAGQPLWQRLAFYIQAAWIDGRFDAPAWAHLSLVQSLRLAWAGKPLEEAGSVPLFPAWLQSTAALGDLAPLAGLVEARFDWLANPANTAVQLQALRLANRLKAAHLIRPVVSLLVPRALDDRVMANDVIQGVLALARLAESPEELRDVGRALQVLLPDAAAVPSPRWHEAQLVTLGWVALRCVNLGALRRVVRELVARGPGASSDDILGWAFILLMRHETDSEIAELLVQAASALPGSPLIQMRRAKLAREQDASDEEVEAFVAPLDPAAPGYRTAILWLANDQFRAGRWDLSVRYFERAQAMAPLSAGDLARLAQLEVRGTPKVPIQVGSDDHFSLATDSPLEGALAPMLELLNTSWTHEGGVDAAALRQAGALAVAHFAAALPSLVRLPLAEFANAAHELNLLANQYFRDLARMPVYFEFALTPAYGSLDFARCAAVSDITHEHLLTLAEFVIGMERPLQGEPERSKPGAWFDVLRWGCDSALALGSHERALALVQHAQRRLGVEAGGDLVARIEEQCLLAAGRLDEARAVRRRMLRDADAEVISLRRWPEWVRGLDERPVLCLDDAALDGHFEKVGPDGVLRAWPHKAMPTSLWRVAVRNARVLLSYGLEGPGDAGMLRPNDWHLAMAEYPYAHVDVLNRGKAAAVLRPGPVRTIDEPVLLLANMDALVHRNYYHWMLLILTRAVWALEEGWLKGRRLLVPREMSRWMWSSLADAGIDQDRLLAYGKHERLALSDALVISPVEYASPSLLRRLQHRMWRAAGLDPASPPPQDKLVYMTRKDTNGRPLVEERDLSRLAEELGFEVVAPETLSLLDQVRLFARAQGIAGPTGAAFTNLAWAQPGTRVLSIFKEEVTMPTFVDLSTILGQHHRWLLGRPVAGFKAVHPISGPFSVDLGLARRELNWVRCGEGSPTPASTCSLRQNSH